MVVSLPAAVIILLDFAAWFAIHMGAAWLMTWLPASRFRPDAWLFRLRRWERDGRLYDDLFRVRRWKELLPDGAAMFRSGFRKKRLEAREQDYYMRFMRETCRGELTHWAVIATTPVFAIWNWWWAMPVMAVYALAANMPCIITQRFNRGRLARIVDALDHMDDISGNTGEEGADGA